MHVERAYMPLVAHAPLFDHQLLKVFSIAEASASQIALACFLVNFFAMGLSVASKVSDPPG